METFIKAVIAEMLKEYGLTVCTHDGKLQLHWELYVQGGGVAFSATVNDFGPIARIMHANGDLAEASMVKRLVDKHGLQLALRHKDDCYTHACTMDVETSGPVTFDDDASEIMRVIEVAKEAMKELRDNASVAAQNLLTDWFAISERDMKYRRVYKTKCFKVEVIKQSGGEYDTANDALEGRTPADALAVMREAVKTDGIKSYQVGVTVSRRSTPESHTWREISSDEIDGGIFTDADVRSVIKRAINNARSTLQSNTTAHKEAA